MVLTHLFQIKLISKIPYYGGAVRFILLCGFDIIKPTRVYFVYNQECLVIGTRIIRNNTGMCLYAIERATTGIGCWYDIEWDCFGL